MSTIPSECHVYLIAGKIGISLEANWFEAKRETEPGIQDALERAIQFQLGWFAEPIFGTGDYPRIMKEQIANKSTAHGVPNRLPEFTKSQQANVKGTK